MKNNKNTSNLIFSAFLVIAYVICAYFFVGLINGSTALDDTVKSLSVAAVFTVFGLILFYATRIGDGKQIKRFSLATLIIMDLPALYIILASAAQGLPFPLDISKCPEIVYFAAVTLGYGIPYTFLSGYEQEIPTGEKDEVTPQEAKELYGDEEEIQTSSSDSELDELEKLITKDTSENDVEIDDNDQDETEE